MEQALNGLRDFPVLQGTSSDELAVLVCLLKPVTFADGAFVFHQGDVAEYMLLIEKGSVEVLDEVSEATLVRLALRQEGDSIGEMALIDHHRHTASIRALETVNGWALSHDDFHRLRQEPLAPGPAGFNLRLYRPGAVRVPHRLLPGDQ